MDIEYSNPPSLAGGSDGGRAGTPVVQRPLSAADAQKGATERCRDVAEGRRGLQAVVQGQNPGAARAAALPLAQQHREPATLWQEQPAQLQQPAGQPLHQDLAKKLGS